MSRPTVRSLDRGRKGIDTTEYRDRRVALTNPAAWSHGRTSEAPKSPVGRAVSQGLVVHVCLQGEAARRRRREVRPRRSGHPSEQTQGALGFDDPPRLEGDSKCRIQGDWLAVRATTPRSTNRGLDWPVALDVTSEPRHEGCRDEVWCSIRRLLVCFWHECMDNVVTGIHRCVSCAVQQRAFV